MKYEVFQGKFRRTMDADRMVPETDKPLPSVKFYRGDTLIGIVSGEFLVVEETED